MATIGIYDPKAEEPHIFTSGGELHGSVRLVDHSGPSTIYTTPDGARAIAAAVNTPDDVLSGLALLAAKRASAIALTDIHGLVAGNPVIASAIAAADEMPRRLGPIYAE